MNKLNNDIYDIICNKLNIKILLTLKLLNKSIYKLIKKNEKYDNIIRIMASNYIKFWWLSKKLNKDEIICISKPNSRYNTDINNGLLYDILNKSNLDYCIFTYNINNNTNIHNTHLCKYYNKFEQKSIYNYFSKKKCKKLTRTQICIQIHPYMLLNKNLQKYINHQPLEFYECLFSDNIQYNINKNTLKKILFNV
tara:strand:- start:2217 stop:2801 length:585 start_codon:yes stop_codon:yes gene_type:complete